MKTVSLALLVALGFATAQMAAQMPTQMPAKPPMKMGLWETNTLGTISMPGVSMPPGAAGRPTTLHSCATPETYAQAFQEQQQRMSCERSNEKWTANGYSFDMTCGGNRGRGHFAIVFDTPEAGHGTMHLETTAGEHSMLIDMSLKTRWLSADCGSVAPGKVEMIR